MKTAEKSELPNVFWKGRRKYPCEVCGGVALENINFRHSLLCKNTKFLKDYFTCKLFQLLLFFFFSVVCLWWIVFLKGHSKPQVSLCSPEKFVSSVCTILTSVNHPSCWLWYFLNFRLQCLLCYHSKYLEFCRKAPLETISSAGKI